MDYSRKHGEKQLTKNQRAFFRNERTRYKTAKISSPVCRISEHGLPTAYAGYAMLPDTGEEGYDALQDVE